MRKLRNLVAGLSALVASSGCAGIYHDKTFDFPTTTNCNAVTRWIPGDKIYYIPLAAGKGIAANAFNAINSSQDVG